uniref:non-specific serine/threonine protein kinase n=1 Tax=Hirondellea gigas TaxID=1518452 RepID=A0A6A7G348_9CRUS
MVLPIDADDTLRLAKNGNVRRMLTKNGQNFPKPEVVYFSDLLLKINRKDKEQSRVIMVTDKAIYNLMPNDYGKCKRRIKLEHVASVTVSQISDEFVVHVPEEYDYRYKSDKKVKIANLISQLYKQKTNKRLKTTYKSDDILKGIATTKKQARLQSREERLRRQAELLDLEDNDSDKEDATAKTPAETRQLLQNTEKVGLDDFEFLKVIGRGSFGKVMQVRKKDTGEIYAMKILKKDAIIARNQVEHTRAERKILQALTHPFLMGLRYAFQTKGKLYFVLDYYRGGELFFHLKQKRRFSEEEARLLVAEVCLALGHLHKLDVIYRDLKPENILLDHTGHLCLTDFGLSKDLSPDNPEAHTFCGTPEYLAPEIVMGCGHGVAVDWWSTGILLYEITVGIPPFYSQNVNEMYHKIQHGILRFPPFLTENCKQLIIKLLNRNPDERLGSGPDDVEEIKKQPFFDSIDWEKLLRKEIEPPYKPNVKGKEDTSNFDVQFTDEPVVDSLVTDSNLAGTSDTFVGFTYVEKPVI